MRYFITGFIATLAILITADKIILNSKIEKDTTNDKTTKRK